jgi:hypothetical protein
LNILNKFSNKIPTLPTLNLYNFSYLKKPYYNFELSSYQNQLSIKLMKDIKILIAIISNRYKYIEHRKEINPEFIFTINDEILDYLNIFGNDELFRDYKTMSIMDLHTLNKNLIIDNIIELKETNKQDNIIFNILLLSSYIFKDDNKISTDVYCKLVKQYFLIKNSKLLNDLTYGMIFLMNKRINKSDIQKKLIKELSSFNIDLSDITIFSKYAKYNPKTKKRESFDEIVTRYQNMMVDKFPDLEFEIINNCKYIRDYKVLPSMRMMQFAGKAIEVNNSRGYNCS